MAPFQWNLPAPDPELSLQCVTTRSAGAAAGHVSRPKASGSQDRPASATVVAGKCPSGLTDSERRGRRRSVEPISSRPHSCVRHA